MTHHVEPYESHADFSVYVPSRLAALVIHDDSSVSLSQIFETMQTHGRYVPIVLYAAQPSPETIVDAIERGAIDYWALPLDPFKVAERLELVFQRSEALMERRRKKAEARKFLSILTPRELDVARGVARGDTNKEIARVLAISSRTVEVHRANMMDKLGVRRMSAIVRTAIIADLD